MNLPDSSPPGEASRAAIPTGWRAFWLHPRQPFIGIALAAMVGILLAEALPAGFDPWRALGGFLALAILFACRPRAWVCWAVVLAAFALLHLFHLHDLPAEALARHLPTDARERSAIVRATGTVLDVPRPSADGETLRFTLGLDRIGAASLAWESHARIAAYWRNAPPVACGDRVELTGEARNIAGARNPGEFDFAIYSRRQGVRSEIRVHGISDGRVIRAAGRANLRRVAQGFHDWMRAALGKGLEKDPEAGAVVSTMLLGLRESPGLDDLEEVFQRTGTLHYFAIDGLKLAFLTGMLSWALIRAGVPRAWARLVCLPALAFYALATGLGPASLRATLMAAALLGAWFLERPLRPLNALGAAAAGLLACDTNQLFDLGFQLSFGVVLAVVLLAGPLQRSLERFGAPDPFLPQALFTRGRRFWEWVRRHVWGVTAVSLAAWVGSAPVMIGYFHVISPLSPLANAVAFPLAWLILLLGAAALPCAGLLPFAGGSWAVNVVNGSLARVLLLTVRGFDAVPSGSYYLPPPRWPPLAPTPTAEIAVLDLGRDRAIHLRAGGADWLIDTGRASTYGRVVQPFLRRSGVNRLAGLILTQADAMHLAAAPQVLADWPVGRILDNTAQPGRSSFHRDLLTLLAKRNRRTEVPPPGTVLALGAAARGEELRVLYPPPEQKGRVSADRALVLQVRVAGWKVLLLSDGGAAVARWLLEHPPADGLHSDVLVTGASPGALNAAPDFLAAVAPRLTVVQTTPGAGGHAALPETQFRLEDSGATTLEIYPDRIETSGFVDGRRLILRRSDASPAH